MERKYIKMHDAWKKAEKELEISISSPFHLKMSTGEIISHPILVKEFGSPSGTIILDFENIVGVIDIKNQGYYCSALNPEAYSEYNRDLFIETLKDWGFFGNQIPKWYV